VFASLARMVTKRPKTIMLGAGLLFVVAIFLGVQSFGKLQSGGFSDPNAQSTVALNLINKDFGGQTNIVILVHANRELLTVQPSAKPVKQLHVN
jgi:RND superfamily putative drug exporter